MINKFFNSNLVFFIFTIKAMMGNKIFLETNFNPASSKFYYELSQNITGGLDTVSQILKLNDDLFATAEINGTSHIFNTKQGFSIEKEINLELGSRTKLAGLSNQDFVAVDYSGNNSSIKIYKAEGGYNDVTYLNSDRNVTSLKELKSGLLLTGSVDKSVQLWGYDKKQIIEKSSQFNIYSIKQLKNGFIVFASFQNITVWDPNNISFVNEIPANENYVTSLLELKNGLLVVGGYDKFLRIFNPKKNFNLIRLVKSDQTRALLELNNGLIIGGCGDFICVYNPKLDWEIVSILEERLYTSLALLQINDSLFASASSNGDIHVFNVKNTSLNTIITGHETSVNSLVLLCPGILASASDDGKIKLWEINNGFKLYKEYSGDIKKLSKIFVMDNGNIVSLSNDLNLRILDASHDFKVVQDLSGHTDKLDSIIQLSNGNLISASRNEIIVWNKFHLIKTFEGDTNHYLDFLELQEGNIATYGYNSSTIEIYELENDFKKVSSFDNHTGVITDFVLLNKTHLASSSFDGSIKIWDVSNYKLIKSLHTDHPVLTLSLSNGLIAAGNIKGSILLWNTTDFELLQEIKGHHDAVTGIVDLQDEKLISSSLDASLKVWVRKEVPIKPINHNWIYFTIFGSVIIITLIILGIFIYRKKFTKVVQDQYQKFDESQ